MRSLQRTHAQTHTRSVSHPPSFYSPLSLLPRFPCLDVCAGGHLLLAKELDEFVTINSSARTMLRAVFGEVRYICLRV